MERVYAPAEVEPPSDAARPEETAAFLRSVLDATPMDISAAFRAKHAGHRREVDVHRGALRLTDEALAELLGHIEQLAALGAERAGRDSYPDDQDFFVLADPEGNCFCIVSRGHEHRWVMRDLRDPLASHNQVQNRPAGLRR